MEVNALFKRFCLICLFFQGKQIPSSSSSPSNSDSFSDEDEEDSDPSRKDSHVEEWDPLYWKTESEIEADKLEKEAEANKPPEDDNLDILHMMELEKTKPSEEFNTFHIPLEPGTDPQSMTHCRHRFRRRGIFGIVRKEDDDEKADNPFMLQKEHIHTQLFWPNYAISGNGVITSAYKLT